MKNYWLHRISHEWEISYPLLEKGYLSYGWNDFSNTDLLEKTKTEGWSYFETFMSKNNITARSRYSLWRFFNFKKGDIIVVPLFSGNFCICEVIDETIEIQKIPFDKITTEANAEAILTDKGFVICEGNRKYDIGYVIRVKNLTGKLPRSYADANLISRMKIRTANAEINDLVEDVGKALTSDSPINIHDELLEATLEPIKSVIDKYVTPDNLEHIIKNYMVKKGASKVWIPAKNERDKENGADADIVAEFEDLHLIFYIQAKKHTGETSEWAVKQIYEYCDQRQEPLNGYTYIPWAVSTTDFSEEAILLAQEKGVRLIGGRELIKMIVDCGITNII